MKKHTLIKVFAGEESSAILLKNRLSEIGIESIIKNDSSNAFFGARPEVIDLYIDDNDLEKAGPIIMETT
jgi:hypothetical protein